MKRLIDEKYLKYLPSKKFTYLIIGVIVLGLIFFIISSIFFGKNSYIALNKQAKLQNEKITIDNLLQKDTDRDGVMDWEEALWGTDPNKEITFNDTKDIDYIKQKRDDLKLSNESELTTSGDGLTETDKFAQQFFASLTAMKQSGQIDQTTINNVSASLGQNIIDPNLINKYTEKDINLSANDGAGEQIIYYTTAQKIFEKYKTEGLGDELEIVSNIVGSENTQNSKDSIDKLTNIANAYQEFAQKMIELKVPESLTQYHLPIINSANNTGVSVRNMIKVIDDPIIGLSGLSQYQQYSDDLIISVENLKTILSVLSSNNDIITE
ncbi:MAG: hypothetical protein WC264_03680 [Candidatus Paceibacterota bacterium]|jgi:hypothetical protein